MDALNYAPARPKAARGARLSLALLLTINLFNYIDRYVLAAVEPEIRGHFFPESVGASAASAKDQLMASMAKTGSLATAFLLSYMIAASYLLTNLLVGVVLNALQEAHAAEKQPAPQPAAGIEQRVAALRTALEELERELGAERVGAGR